MIRSAQQSRPGIQDIARHAGVSHSTVLRTMKGMSSVSKETADKVWGSLEELGYIPQNGSRVGVRNRLLGLLIAPLSAPHSAELTARFHECATSLGFDVLTRSIGDDHQQALQQIQVLLDRKVEGIAALSLTPDPALSEALSRVNVPVLCCDPMRTAQTTALLSIDYGRGVREAVQHLALLGHREIAFIGAASKCLATKHKCEAFRLALKEIGCTPNNDWLIGTESSFTGAIAGTEHLLAFTHLPTAVLCSCDAVALGVLWTLRHHDITVPDRMSLICLDDCQFAEWMAPPVTTVQISVRDFARTAVDVLQSMIENPLPPLPRNEFKIPTTLIVRGSTSYPPGRALPKSIPQSAMLEQNSA